MLAYMLYDPALIEAVRNETKPALSDGNVDIDYLVNRCPKLNSVWDETMRVTAFAASVRFLTEDVELGGKILRKGNRIMMPQRQLHFSERIFGDKVTEFDSDRFIRNPTLKRNPSLRPFGGGSTLCPGRFIAKHTTLVFIALALQRFDMNLDPPSQPFPIPEEGNPTLGLVDLKKGYDLKVKLNPRAY
jgi:cytochrome P450